MAQQPPRVIVTRPLQDALQWVGMLGAHDIRAQALPLIEIRPATHPAALQALQAAHRDWAQWRAVMFVSSNAVHYFFHQNSVESLSHQAQTAIKKRVWTPGPGTSAALLALGWDAAHIDAPPGDAPQFDSEALWQVVAGQIHPGDRVLIVRGTSDAAQKDGTGRQWLAERIHAAGGTVHFVTAYERAAPMFNAAQQALAQQAAVDGSIWLLSSSEAVAHLHAALPGQSWAQARALATHPRIAAAARAAGFGHVQPCRPALQDVIASIESWYEH